MDFEGDNLMKTLKANAHPTQLGRCLRRTIFGVDGLVKDMIGSERSLGRIEAPRDKIAIFEGSFSTFSNRFSFVLAQ